MSTARNVLQEEFEEITGIKEPIIQPENSGYYLYYIKFLELKINEITNMTTEASAKPSSLSVE